MGKMETTEGVNTASVESPTTEATIESPVETQTPAESLAEALKTDTNQQQEKPHEKYVPYDRFQEAIKAKQELEQKLSDDTYKQFQEWDNIVRQNPQVAQLVQESIANYVNAQQQQLQQSQNLLANAQQQMDPNNPLSQVLPYIQAQQQQLQVLMQQQRDTTYKQYEVEFNNKLSSNSVPDAYKPLYRSLVEQNMPTSALDRYDPQHLNKVFENVHKQIDSMRRADRASLVQEKSKDSLPPSNSGKGATPRVVTADSSPESLRNEFLELLKA